MTTISAKIICDSISEAGIRLTTFEVTFPRCILAEWNTHRAFSRNTSSSRAIPTEKMIKMVETNPYIPIEWGLNQKGMQAKTLMSELGAAKAEKVWLRARDNAVAQAKELLVAKEVVHKQILNRILEPFLHVTAVVTATEWNNFFALRDHEAAQPEIRELAKRMREALAASTPKKRASDHWHLPYIVDEDAERAMAHVIEHILPRGDFFTEGWLSERTEELLFKMSAARCARVSYLNQENVPPTVQEDLDLFDRLMKDMPMHASPVEHQATPDWRSVVDSSTGEEAWANKHLHGNFVGWRQFRKSFVGENIPTNRA
jgi:thymidylate synthase ThyX